MIQARQLTKRYGRTLAVDQLSFEVGPGRVTGFLGPNGAGKSTTLRLILGLDTPNEGTVTVSGGPYGSRRRPMFEVGAMLEARSLHPGRSAYNHLLALAQSNGVARRRVDEVLGAVGLTSVAGHRVGSFSLGMGQRLGVAAALLGDPGVLLLDEPVNGLDPRVWRAGWPVFVVNGTLAWLPGLVVDRELASAGDSAMWRIVVVPPSAIESFLGHCRHTCDV